MDMQATPHIYEAFVQAGFEPANANMVERAIRADTDERQNKIVKEILDHVMTKEDCLRLENKLEQEVLRLGNKLESVRSELKQDGLRLENKLESVRSELKQDGLRLENKLEQDVLRLETKLESVRSDLLSQQNKQMTWYVGLMFVAVGAATFGVELLHKFG